MAAQSKLELILELENRIKGKLSQAQGQISASVSAIKGKPSKMKESHVKAFSAIKEGIPGL